MLARIRKPGYYVLAIGSVAALSLFAGWRIAEADDVGADEIALAVPGDGEVTELPPEMAAQVETSVENFFGGPEGDIADLRADLPTDAGGEYAITERGDRALVNVVVTSVRQDEAAGAIEVAGYIPVLDSGGTCTLRLTGPVAESVEIARAAFEDAATTICSGLTVPRELLSAGTWLAALGYESDAFLGASLETELVVK